MIRLAHPRVQYLAMLPVHWVMIRKGKSQAWDDRATWPSPDVNVPAWLTLSLASEVMLRAAACSAIMLQKQVIERKLADELLKVSAKSLRYSSIWAMPGVMLLVVMSAVTFVDHQA